MKVAKIKSNIYHNYDTFEEVLVSDNNGELLPEIKEKIKAASI